MSEPPQPDLRAMSRQQGKDSDQGSQSTRRVIGLAVDGGGSSYRSGGSQHKWKHSIERGGNARRNLKFAERTLC